MLCEPLTLTGAKHKDHWLTWRANIQARQDVTARLAAKYKVALVRFPQALDVAVLRAPAEYWFWDTVHHTYAGHQILADEWVHIVQQAWPIYPDQH